jgi:hypothetical protein
MYKVAANALHENEKAVPRASPFPPYPGCTTEQHDLCDRNLTLQRLVSEFFLAQLLACLLHARLAPCLVHTVQCFDARWSPLPRLRLGAACKSCCDAVPALAVPGMH